MANKVYLTTPIYYVNSKPHIGHAYTTLAVDVLSRYYRLLGKDIFFLTGTDEHGAKIVQAAEKAGKEPQDFCDEISALFKSAWQNLDIEYSRFIRTTDEEHKKWVQRFLGTLKENRIISAENIIKIKSKAIIVKGEEPKAKVEEKEKVKATIPEPA